MTKLIVLQAGLTEEPEGLAVLNREEAGLDEWVKHLWSIARQMNQIQHGTFDDTSLERGFGLDA
jgi:hypothetical protein